MSKNTTIVVVVVLSLFVGFVVLVVLGGLGVAGALYVKTHARVNKDHNEALAFNNSGLAWYEKKDYDRAIQEYDQAIRLDPKFAQAFDSRGLSWYSKKDYDRAILDYDHALRLIGSLHPEGVKSG